jgi:hypothetical protein
MNFSYHRNNPTLFLMPEFLWNPNWLGKHDYNVWSCHTWVRNNRFLPSYQVWIYYKFEPDFRNLMRAQVRNIWYRSQKIEVYCKGIQLEGDELEDAKLEIRARLMQALERTSLKGYPVRRYIFNVVAALPNVILKGFHSHHESRYNSEMVKIAASNGKTISEHWLKATDDRFDNVNSLTPDAHYFKHICAGDIGYADFNDAKNRAGLVSEISNVREEIKEQNVAVEKCTNLRVEPVTEFWDYDNLMAKLQVFYNSKFDSFEQRRYENLATQI